MTNAKLEEMQRDDIILYIFILVCLLILLGLIKYFS